MGGIAGFMGTVIVGPRIGLYKEDKQLAFVHKDLYLEDDHANQQIE